VVLLVIS